MTSPVDFISGPSRASEPGEAAERPRRLLHRHVAGRGAAPSKPISARLWPSISRHCQLGQRHTGRLGDERHRARGARIGLDHVQLLVAVDGKLDVDRPSRPAAARSPRRLLDLGQHLGAERHRRDHAGRVAGVHARLFDVLHDRPDAHLLPRRRGRRRRSRSRSRGSDRGRWCRSASARRFSRSACAVQVVRQAAGRVADLHRATAEHVRRSHQQRVAHPCGGGERLVSVLGGGIGRAAHSSSSSRPPKLGRSSARWIDSPACRAAARPAAASGAAASRRLAAELDDHALGLLQLDHAEHIRTCSA